MAPATRPWHSTPTAKRCASVSCCAGALLLLATADSQALSITVDYSYDTNNFFTTQASRDAIEAAASRYSAIITTSLNAVSLVDDNRDQRIGFNHPGLGSSYQVSSANSQGSDALAGTDVASEYRGAWSIAQDEWILYAGGRSIGSAGVGGTGTGLNFSTVFTDPNSVLNRGFRTTSASGNLPVWGGAISFDNGAGQNWHFDHTSVASTGSLDFYSIALHEIGHALGLSTSWNDWDQSVTGGVFNGNNAVAAYNSDNGTAVTGLNQVDAVNRHWQDGSYDSNIFAAGNPNYTGTVGAGNPQDLLMEPIANFTGSVRRFELTNVDVAALQDVGWSVVPVPLPAALPMMLGALVFGRLASRRRAS